MVNATVIGSLIALVALGATVLARPWEAWAQTLMGLWLGASPWALGFETDDMALSTAVALGGAFVALAAWVLVDVAGKSTERGAGANGSG